MDSKQKAQAAREILADPEAMEAARIAIEDLLVEMRDAQMFMSPSGNGFTIREKDTSPSQIMRFSTRYGLDLAMRSIAEHLEKKEEA